MMRKLLFLGTSLWFLLVPLGGAWSSHPVQELPADADPGGQLFHWGDTLSMDPGVVDEMATFGTGGRSLGSQAAGRYAGMIRASVFGAARDALDAMERSGCEPFVRVSFPEPEEWGAVGLDSPEEEFLKGMVKTEAVACYSTSTPPERALDIYTDSEFRMEAESRIQRMWTQDGLSCVSTKGVPLLLAPTEVCNRVNRFTVSDLAAEHSQVVRNASEEGLQRIFFKESLKTFLVIPRGLGFHYVNYSRSLDLGGPTKWAARGKIGGSQEGQMEQLRRRIGGF